MLYLPLLLLCRVFKLSIRALEAPCIVCLNFAFSLGWFWKELKVKHAPMGVIIFSKYSGFAQISNKKNLSSSSTSFAFPSQLQWKGSPNKSSKSWLVFFIRFSDERNRLKLNRCSPLKCRLGSRMNILNQIYLISFHQNSHVRVNANSDWFIFHIS